MHKINLQFQIIFLVIFFSFLIHLPIYGQETKLNNQANVTVSLTIDTLVEPDEIYLNFNLKDRANINKQSIEDIEKVIFNSLINIGINLDKDLTIKNFYNSSKNQSLRAKKVLTSKEYVLKIYDISLISDIFDLFKEQGISTIYLSKLKYKDEDILNDFLLIQATKLAKMKAVLVAAELNQKIGKAIKINIQDNSNPFPYQRVMAAQSIGINKLEEGKNFSLHFEPIKFSKTIYIEFELF